MSITLYQDENTPLILKSNSPKKYEDLLLRGSKLMSYKDESGFIHLQAYNTPACTVHYGVARWEFDHSIFLKEPNEGILLTAALKQSFRYNNGKKLIEYRPGQFDVSPSNGQMNEIFLEKGKEYRIFCSHYSQDLLSQLGLESVDFILNDYPRAFTPKMSDLIYDLLSADYQPEMLRFYYENKVRELLFMALAYENVIPPPSFSQQDTDTIYSINSMIINNLTDHFSIRDISSQFNINEFKLKKGFRQIIGTGLFERLLDTRLIRAKQLLIKTNKAEKEIAQLTGYNRLTSFITAFRKKTGKTPREFRIEHKRKGL